MKVIILNARQSFFNYFEPKAFDADSKPKFDGTFICDADTKIKVNGKVVSYSKLNEVSEQVMKEKWGKVVKAKNWAYNKADGSTTREAQTNGDGEYYTGYTAETFFVSGSVAAEKLGQDGLKVYDKVKRKLSKTDGVIYSGCRVNAVVEIYAVETKHGNMICCELRGVQFAGDDEPFGGSMSDCEDDFEFEEGDTIGDEEGNDPF
jgi:hypothetical protein